MKPNRFEPTAAFVMKASQHHWLGALCALALAATFAALVAPAHAQDPLPSWNDTAPKKAIIGLVERVTKEGSPDFVPPADRIATFDNDGTLWAEQPVYFQVAFALDRVKALSPKHPEWKTTEPFKSVLAGDSKGLLASGEKGIKIGRASCR